MLRYHVPPASGCFIYIYKQADSKPTSTHGLFCAFFGVKAGVELSQEQVVFWAGVCGQTTQKILRYIYTAAFYERFQNIAPNQNYGLLLLIKGNKPDVMALASEQTRKTGSSPF